MTLTKELIVDKIEVMEDGTVQVRTATRVLEDGEVISSSFHRHVCTPDHVHTGNEDPRVHAVCAAVHTDAVIAAYLASQEVKVEAMGAVETLNKRLTASGE